MAKKYASYTTLQAIVNNIKSLFATKTELNSKLSSKSDTSHTHNDIYYTKTETDSALSQKSQVQIITWEADD